MFLVVIVFSPDKNENPLAMAFNELIDATFYYHETIFDIYQTNNRRSIESISFCELHVCPAEITGEYTTVEYDDTGMYLITSDGEGVEEVDLYK